MRAWTVFLHNGALPRPTPSARPRTRSATATHRALPGEPGRARVRRALAADVARLGVATICAESLHYHALEHGYAHERYFVPLGRARATSSGSASASTASPRRAPGVDGEDVRARRAR